MMHEEIDFLKIIAVSNRHLSRLTYLEQVERICSFHPKAFLLREKDLPPEDYLKLAREVKVICERYKVLLIPHFYPEAAETVGSGVLHLPLWKLKERQGISVEKGRTDGQEKDGTVKIGVSIHSAEEAKEAVRLGASYLTAGHIFTTDCKKGVPARGLEFLKEVCEISPVPVYGIGGIHLDAEQIRSVLEQGAEGVCIMSEMMRI